MNYTQSIIFCPVCKNQLEIVNKKIICSTCNKVYSKNSILSFPGTIINNSNLSYDYIAHYYDLTRKIKKEVVDLIPLIIKNNNFFKDGDVILEIGTGTGNYLIPFINNHIQSIGVDVSIKMLKIFQKKVNKKNQNYLLLHADAYHIPIRDSSVDIILTSAFFHLIKDIETILKEIKRILKPSGYLINIDPDVEQEKLQISKDVLSRYYSLAKERKQDLPEGYGLDGNELRDYLKNNFRQYYQIKDERLKFEYPIFISDILFKIKNKTDSKQIYISKQVNNSLYREIKRYIKNKYKNISKIHDTVKGIYLIDIYYNK